jgi:hypothetical protein
MHWKISHLDPGLREKLAQVHVGRGLGGSSPHYFRSQDHPGRVLACLGIGAVLTAGSGLLLRSLIVENEGKPLVAIALIAILFLLAVVWTFVSALELFRTRSATIRPFLLITPKVLLRSDYGFAALEAYRLSDATGFESAKVYHGQNQSYQGQRYTFRFPGATVIFTARAAAEISALDDVLARARSGGGPEDPGAIFLPEGAGSPKRPGYRAFTNPVGEFWLAIAGLLLVLMLVGMVVSSIVRRFRS